MTDSRSKHTDPGHKHEINIVSARAWRDERQSSNPAKIKSYRP